jgi:hypothetical protein
MPRALVIFNLHDLFIPSDLVEASKAGLFFAKGLV